MKNKITTIIVIISTLILAGIAVFTAVRLYQLRQVPVAPSAPESKPKAAANSCKLSFTLVTTSTGSPTSSPTQSPTNSPTSTATSTATGTAIATATPTTNPSGTPNYCGGTCGSNNNCQGDYVCYQGFCRNPSCVTKSNCSCGTTSTTAPTTAPTQAALPDSGTGWPSIFGMGLGVMVIIGSLFLAL